MDKYYYNDEEENEDDATGLKGLKVIVRMVCDEARRMDNPYDDCCLIKKDGLGCEMLILAYRGKAHIMKEWGHDYYSVLFQIKENELTRLYDDILDRCEEFVN